MRELLNTLYVLTQGSYLRLDHETVVQEVDGKPNLKVPLHHLGAIVCFGNVMMTPFLLHRCAADGRAVVLLSEHGRFCARLEGPRSGNVLLRRAQHEAASDAARAAKAARSFVAGKIQNARMLLLRARRESEDEAARGDLEGAAAALAIALSDVERERDLDGIRGVEGQAAKAYFEAFNAMLRVNHGAFRFDGRNRRPPRDRMNALLSFLYALLVNDCRSAVEAAGLDPQLGLFHALRPGRPGLALDLMEEFRPLLADRLAFALINRRQLDESDFEERPGGAIVLAEKGRKTVIAAYQKRKQEELRHPEMAETMPLGLAPFVQARLLARHVRGDADLYVPFVPR
jgi:CRISPR-associated protein Cas1